MPEEATTLQGELLLEENLRSAAFAVIEFRERLEENQVK